VGRPPATLDGLHGDYHPISHLYAPFQAPSRRWVPGAQAMASRAYNGHTAFVVNSGGQTLSADGDLTTTSSSKSRNGRRVRYRS
jgi:hypothetical protein